MKHRPRDRAHGLPSGTGQGEPVKIKSRLAPMAARFVRKVIRMSGRGAGTSLPGLVLLKIDPSFPRRMAASIPGGIVLVSGTNGKTTTASLLRHILSSQGFRVAGNEAGANLLRGAATALMDAGGADIAVLEIDEAALANVAAEMRPHLLVLTNIFRDQLDRYGEVEAVAGMLAGGVAEARSDATVVYNGDDPLLHYSLEATGRHRVAFGLRLALPNSRTGSDAGGEPEVCPRCGRQLAYQSRTFAHLGQWRCDACGLEGPSACFVAELTHDDGFEGLDLRFGGREVRLSSGGLHSAYNATAAVAAAIVLGVPRTSAASALVNFTPRFGRAETISFQGHEVTLALAKNPAGANSIIEEIGHDGHLGSVVVSINDRDADGHDPSWIWDVDFERLRDVAVPLVASGTRAEDVAVRLKHSGRAPERTARDPRPALHDAVDLAGDRKVVVLANYTAMLDLRAALSGKRGALEDAR